LDEEDKNLDLQYLYHGISINNELTINEQIKELDKNRKRMVIYVNNSTNNNIIREHFYRGSLKNIKYTNSKSIKNDKEKKLFNKKKTYNVSNKSIHIDSKSIDKTNNLMKSSSLVFNKYNLKEQIIGNTLINATENNYEMTLGNEIDELTNLENLLNQVKDYINSNRNSKNIITRSSLNTKK